MPGQSPSKPRPFLQAPISDIWGAEKSQQIQMWPENKHILETEDCQGARFWQVPVPALLPPTSQRPGMLDFYSEQLLFRTCTLPDFLWLERILLYQLGAKTSGSSMQPCKSSVITMNTEMPASGSSWRPGLLITCECIQSGNSHTLQI